MIWNNVADLDIIFDSLDEDKSGLVSMDEFCKLFEPTIVRRASSSGTMDVEDLMKETFSGILLDAKMERSVVIQGFMKAHNEIEKSGKVSDVERQPVCILAMSKSYYSAFLSTYM